MPSWNGDLVWKHFNLCFRSGLFWFQGMMGKRIKKYAAFLEPLKEKNVDCLLTLAKWSHCTQVYLIWLAFLVYLAAASVFVTVPFSNCFFWSLHERGVLTFLYYTSVVVEKGAMPFWQWFLNKTLNYVIRRLEGFLLFGFFCLFVCLFSHSITFLLPTKPQSKKEVLVKCKNDLEQFFNNSRRT